MQIVMAVDGVAVLLNPLHILRTFARNWVWRIGAVARGINKLAAGILAVITWDAVGLSALVLCPVGSGPHLKRRTCHGAPDDLPEPAGEAERRNRRLALLTICSN